MVPPHLQAQFGTFVCESVLYINQFIDDCDITHMSSSFILANEQIVDLGRSLVPRFSKWDPGTLGKGEA